MKIVFALLLIIPLMGCVVTDKVGNVFGWVDKTVGRVTG